MKENDTISTIFNRTRYGYAFSSLKGIHFFIEKIKEYVDFKIESILNGGALMELRDIICPCEVYTDENGDHGVLPVYQTDLAACADVCSPKQVVIGPQQSVKIDLLIGFDIPSDSKIVMYPRSSLLIKKGLVQPTSIIDADYSHMHVHVPLWNPGPDPVTIERGERIAQIECVPRYNTTSWQRKNAERTGGFGSTGK